MTSCRDVRLIARRLALMGALLVAGCASVIPEAAWQGVDRNFTFADLRANPDAARGRRVIFGGEILYTTVRAQETEIEVLHFPLRWDDSPNMSEASGGRFLVRRAGFLDPGAYAPGRLVTVAGAVAGSVERPVGEVPYRYPVIQADHLYLWPRSETLYPPMPYYYPWPSYPPYYRYPYHRYPFWYPYWGGPPWW